jgi:hypothetical protein
VLLDDVVGEVVAAEGDLDDDDAEGQQRAEDVDRAARDVDPATFAGGPVRAVTTAKTAVRKARPSAALPRLAGIRRRELRRALGHQRVGLADEGAALEFPGEDDLPPAAEGVGDDAAVGDRQALTATVAVGRRGS